MGNVLNSLCFKMLLKYLVHENETFSPPHSESTFFSFQFLYIYLHV